MALLVLAGCTQERISSGAEGDTATDSDTALPDCGASVFEALSLSSMSPPPQESDLYLVADDADKTAVRSSLEAWFEGDSDVAIQEGQRAGYDLCRGTGVESDWVLWSPAGSGQGRALWALNTDAEARGLIVETPHPEHDLDTLPQGVELVRALNARALITSGTHRCANTTATQCSGQTRVCTGEPAPYPESDMAHTLASRFQAAHEAIAEHFSNDLVVSLHGFADDGVSLSNGTTDPITTQDPVARLVSALEQQLPAEYITTCNAFSGGTEENRLCGTSNVQGRHLNGSPNACTQSADVASQRFIHMEQSLTIRQNETVAVQAAFETLLSD